MTGPPFVDHMHTQLRIASEISDRSQCLRRCVGVHATLFHWYLALKSIYKLQDSSLLGCKVQVSAAKIYNFKKYKRFDLDSSF